MPVRWCPAGRGAVIVRYGCRLFIYVCATLNRNAENVHAGIDWESFPKHRVESKKICVMPACWLPFLEKVLPRDERMGAPWLLRSGEGHAARQGRERPGSGAAGRGRAPAVADAAKRSPSGERHARAGEERRTKGGRGWRIPVMEKTDLHPEKENSKGKRKRDRTDAVPNGINPRPGRCCGVCGGAFLLPLPREGRAWRAVPGCGRALPGAWPPGATA